MPNIPNEQPPTEDPDRLKEWLARMMVLINGALDTVKDMELIGQLPGKIYDGLVVFFNRIIPPDIDYEGPWIVVDGEWRPLVGMVSQEYVIGETYWPQDTVSDGPWSMVCITKTTDRAAPQESGPKEVVLPDVPGFVTDSDSSSVYSGHTYTFTEAGWVGGLRVWVPEISATTNYTFVMIDNTDPTSPTTSTLTSDSLNEGAWTTIVLSNLIVGVGTQLIIFIDAINSGGSTPFGPFGWTYGGQDNNANPPFQNWNTNVQRTVLRIDKTDLDSFDRSAQLLGIITGSQIVLSLTSNPSINQTYSVLSNPVDGGSSINFNSVLLTGSAGTLNIGDVCSVNATIPIAQPTQYSRLDGFFPGGNPSWANITGLLQYDSVVQPGELTTAFGVDIAFTPASVSDDWRLLSYGLGTSDVQGQIASTNVANDNYITGISFAKQDPVVADVPMMVEFGPAQVSINGDASLAANGRVTFNRSGVYDIDLYMTCTRDNAAMTALLIFHASDSMASEALSIDDPVDYVPLEFSTSKYYASGSTLDFFVTIDSSGSTDGYLEGIVPMNPAIPDVPSAWLRVSKRTLNP